MSAPSSKPFLEVADSISTRLSGIKNRQLILIILLTVMLALAGLWIVPRGLGLYFVIRGGQLLDRAMQAASGNSSALFTCETIPDTRVVIRGQVNEAIRLLETSLHYYPKESQAYLLLGRAFCLIGQHEQAIYAYSKYISLHPKNPLGHLELGYAYRAECYQVSAENSPVPLCQDEALRLKSVNEWKEAGLSFNSFVLNAEQAYALSKYEDSYTWYENSSWVSGQFASPDLFRWGVASIITKHSLPMEVNSSILTIYPLSSSLQIKANELQWNREVPGYSLAYGDPLSKFPSSDAAVGVMWWEGTAIAIVDVKCESSYHMTVRARHSNPNDSVQGELEVGLDFSPITHFSVPGSWQEYTIDTHLAKGLHILGFSYSQDVGDLFISWVRLVQVNACKE